MDLGFVSLNTPHDICPGTLGVELESRGFESMWVGEHPQIPVSAKGAFCSSLLRAQKQMWDPLLSLMAAAQATTELRVGTSVALPLEHEIFTFAKQVATLDEMSGGRLRLGIGVGYRAELEHSRPIKWSDRYRAFGDMVEALSALWTTDESEHHGSFFDFEVVWSFPKPRQKPRPTLLAAAIGPNATRACLAWADGWLPGDAAVGDVAKAVRGFRVAVEQAGRDPTKLEMTIMALGDPSLETLVQYRELGFSRVIVGGGRTRANDRSATTLLFPDHYVTMRDELR